MITTACYLIAVIAAWLVLRTAREMFIAWYNGVEIEMSISVKLAIGLQILVGLASIWLAWMAA